MKLIILDRDGVINHDSDDYIKSPDEWQPIDGSLEAIARLNHAGYTIAIASNQSGLARGYFDIEVLTAMHKKMDELLAKMGGRIDAIFYCPHGPDDACHCRKPKPGMLLDIGQRFNVPLDRNGKLNGKAIPLEGPLKALLKEGVKDYSMAKSLYLIPGKGSRAKDDKSMDPKSLAKHQKKFITDVQGQSLSMTQLQLDIKNAMIQVGVSPLVVAYLFHTKVEDYMQLAADDPLITKGLNNWYNG